MADWDDDSPQLRQNLARVFDEIADRAERREPPSLDIIREWHVMLMAGLDVPDLAYVGNFRGQLGLEAYRVQIGRAEGVAPQQVARELARFESSLLAAIAALDARYPENESLDADGLAAVVDVCAWAHAEWIRIHPFASGNGRTARVLANFLLMRYGLPPVVRLRPRPGGDYGNAAARAMLGEWMPMAQVFRRLLKEFIEPSAARASSRGGKGSKRK